MGPSDRTGTAEPGAPVGLAIRGKIDVSYTSTYLYM